MGKRSKGKNVLNIDYKRNKPYNNELWRIVEGTVPKAFKIRTQSEQYEENFMSGFTHEKIEIEIISTKSTEK